jgi:hypothetical protein
LPISVISVSVSSTHIVISGVKEYESRSAEGIMGRKSIFQSERIKKNVKGSEEEKK